MADKRSHVRFRISGTVNIKNESGDSTKLEGELVDLSFRGLAIDFRKKVDLTVGVVVSFEMVSEVWRSPLSVKGRITNIVESSKYGNQSFRVGLEFVDTDEDAISLLITRIRRKIVETKRKKAAAKQEKELQDYIF